MALSGKRTHSELKGPVSMKKRQCIINGISSPALPRSTFLLTKPSKMHKKMRDSDDDTYSSAKGEETNCHDGNIEDRFRTEYFDPDGHTDRFGQLHKLDPRLLEAVSRYSDTESVQRDCLKDTSNFASHTSQADRHQNFNFRKSAPRHASFSIAGTRQKQAPRSDLAARERCFDYILQSIDEVWGRYCNTTSTAENEVYDRLGSCVNASSTLVSSPNCSFYVPAQVGSNNTHNRSPLSDDDSDSGYKSEVTNPTEYETDCDYRKVSNLPQSMRLQSLKDRLVKAKNDLEGSYDCSNWNSCMFFWRRWDMIKYSAVEMMEEDDDDDVIESVIDELEEGRCYNGA